MISAIYFDLGGVIFHYHPDKRLARMAERSGVAEQILQKQLFDSGFSDQCDAGLFSAEEMYVAACDYLAWQPSYEEFRQLWISVFEPNLPVIDLARSLSTHYKVGLLTNNPTLLREGLSDIQVDIECIFDPILFSGELKIMKPQPAIYQIAVEKMGCPAQDILFIDDSVKYLQAAQRVGIKTLHYTTSANLQRELQRYGIQASER